MRRFVPNRFAIGLSTVRRWSSDHRQRQAEWQRHPLYWHLRKRRSDITFDLMQRQFAARTWVSSKREFANAIHDLVRAIAVRFLMALVIVVGLEIADRQLLTQTSAEGRVGIFPHTLQHLWPSLSQLHYVPDTVVSLLATFVQVAGVFLGLYFAAVSLVVSVYASSGAPEPVRGLLVKKLSSNRYIGLIAFFGAVSTLLLAESVIGLEPGTPNLILVTFLGVSSVFGFVVLGVQTFGYLSPVNLAIGLPRELTRWINAATPKGHRWQDSTFQLYYQRQAANQIDVFKEVFEYSVAEERSSARAIAELTNAIIRIEQQYTAQKYRIPTESRWFERVNRFPSWLTASEERVMVLLSTSWQGESQGVQELLWFERRLEVFVEEGMHFLVTRGQLEATVSVMEVGRAALHSMSCDFAVAEALSMLSAMDRATGSALGSIEVSVSDLTRNAPHARFALALHEGSCMGLTAVILGLTRAVEATTLDAFRKAVSTFVWNQPASIYATPLPRPVTQQIERLANLLGFERDIEGHTITPSWYQEQFVGRAFMGFIQTSVADLITHLEEKFGSGVDAELTSGRFLFAIQLVERGLEACMKAEYLIIEAKSCDERMAVLHRVPEEPWPKSNWSAESERVKRVRRRLIRVLGESMPEVLTIDRHEESWPDFFGYTYRLVAHECVSSLIDGDEELFSVLFPAFFCSCLAAHDRLVQELNSVVDPGKSVYISEPIADLLHLSGIVLIASELDGTHFWEVAQQRWDSYLDAVPNRVERMAMLTSTIQYRKSVFMVPPYEGIRLRWQAWLERRFRDQGLIADDFGSPTTLRQTSRRPHESPVIRALSGAHLRLWPGPADVFVVVYLRDRPGGDRLHLTSDQEFFSEKLQKEKHEPSSADEGIC